ncbi:MAG TPA: hypothetical protein VIN07_03825 [Flavipsychrobacter sp.]
MRKKILLAVLSFGLFAINACSPRSGSDDDNPTPVATYRCNNGTKAYLEFNINGTTYTPASGKSATGGVAVITDNGIDKTLLDMGLLTTGNSVYNVKVLMTEVVTPGTYTITQANSPSLIISNTAGYTIKSFTLTFDELINPRGNSIDPDKDFYDKASGSFSGVYADENNADVNFSGVFCSDMEPR